MGKDFCEWTLTEDPFQNAGGTEPLGLIYRKNKILTPAMTTFIQFLKQPAAAVN